MSRGLAELERTIDRALDGHKRSIARLVSHCEDTRLEAGATRDAIFGTLARSSSRRHGLTVGITGTPGAGKSTLVGSLAPTMVRRAESRGDDHRVAVVAVDPSSPVSGGALLGDRTRVRFALDEPRLYFRSQASALALGGIAPSTWPVVRLLTHLFDTVLIETVGIGQSEVDVRALADHLVLVTAPLAGDHVQFMKAGVMEVPDRIVLNKCDQEQAARASWSALRASVRLVRPGGDDPSLHRVSAQTGIGIDDLADALLGASRDPVTLAEAALARRRARLVRRVRERFGSWGVERLASIDLDALVTNEEDDAAWRRAALTVAPPQHCDG